MPPGLPGLPDPGSRGKSRKIIIITRRVVVFLIAGAIVNVAVAWAFAVYAPFWPFARGDSSWWEFDDSWQTEHSNWWISTCPYDGVSPPVQPSPQVVFESPHVRVNPGRRDFVSQVRLAGMLVLAGYTLDEITNEGVHARRICCGWPLHSMTCSRWHMTSSLQPTSDIMIGGIKTNITGYGANWKQITFVLGQRLVPFQPIWPSFAINTIFYAAIVWLLFAAPGMIRKRRRIKRGLCAACAYPVGERRVCTECGAEVKTRTPSPTPGREREHVAAATRL